MNSSASIVEPNHFNTGGVWSAWIDYNGVSDLLEVRYSKTGTRSAASQLSYNVDLTAILASTNAYFGFTSGTGAAGNLHEILSYEFRDDFEPITDVNEPATMGLFLIGCLALIRRKYG